MVFSALCCSLLHLKCAVPIWRTRPYHSLLLLVDREAVQDVLADAMSRSIEEFLAYIDCTVTFDEIARVLLVPLERYVDTAFAECCRKLAWRANFSGVVYTSLQFISAAVASPGLSKQSQHRACTKSTPRRSCLLIPRRLARLHPNFLG